MEEKGAVKNGYDMQEAVVVRVAPLAIRVGETEISVNLSCHPALTLGLSPSSITTEETALKDCFNRFYQAFSLQVKDKVLVQRVGNHFYVLCKVVDAV